MSEACGSACWTPVLVLENKFSHGNQVHPCLVPRLIHPKWQKHRSFHSLKNKVHHLVKQTLIVVNETINHH